MNRVLTTLLLIATLSACAARPAAERDFGVAWVRSAAEFEALALQAYGEAGRDLERLIADKSFSALPSQTDAADLPVAVVLDVDETVVNNANFQIEVPPPFSNRKHDQWHRENVAVAIPGVQAFVEQARAAGATVFFVTNRPCEPSAEEPCPAETTTLDDIAEAGIETDREHLLLAKEIPAWTREKLTRREAIAQTHRVIMLFGDDLGDFLPCIRRSIEAPCTDAASNEDRRRLVEEHAGYWGEGWYLLPNPMYGSWTSFIER